MALAAGMKAQSNDWYGTIGVIIWFYFFVKHAISYIEILNFHIITLDETAYH